MRAELHNNQRMVAFIWNNCDVTVGHIRIYEYNYNLVPYERSDREFPVGVARHYWETLINSGYRVNPSNMPFVPRTDYISTGELLNTFEDSV